VLDADEKELGSVKNHPFQNSASGLKELHIYDYLGDGNVSDPFWIDGLTVE